MMAKFIHRKIHSYKGKDASTADGYRYHKLKVTKNILVEVFRAVTQYKNPYS